MFEKNILKVPSRLRLPVDKPKKYIKTFCALVPPAFMRCPFFPLPLPLKHPQYTTAKRHMRS